MNSELGHAWLQGICAHLEGRTIHKVAFAATESGIATTLHLDNNETYRFMDEESSLETLCEQFGGLFRDLKFNRSSIKEA